VNCNQELCIELLSVINFHCEIEPASSLQYGIAVSDSTVVVRTMVASHCIFLNRIKTLGRTPLGE
jgi:hypothetical protein